jgi:hypothetical protein
MEAGGCALIQEPLMGENAYEIELPDGIRISMIFNVLDLYPYKADDTGAKNDDQPEI